MGLMDKMKASAQNVAAEAKKATAQAQGKMEQMQYRKKADEAAKKLGYLVHKERTQGAAAGAEADQLVQEITDLEAQIAAEGEGSSEGAPATPPPTSSSDATPGDFKL